jgi:putative intracellular protease/amidase
VKKLVLFLVLVVLPLAIAGCGSQNEVAVVTVAPSPTVLPTKEPTEEPTPVPTATPTEEPTPRPTPWSPIAPAGSCEPSETRSCTVLFVLPGPTYAPWAALFFREFEQFGYETLVASNAEGVVRPCEAGGRDVPVDVLMADVNVEDYDALIFVGGYGCRDQWHDKESHRIAQEAVAHEKVLAAVGCASTILAYAGVLEGKEVAVCQTDAAVKRGVDYNELLEGLGAIHGGDIVRDGLVVTAEARSRYFVAGVLETIETLER